MIWSSSWSIIGYPMSLGIPVSASLASLASAFSLISKFIPTYQRNEKLVYNQCLPAFTLHQESLQVLCHSGMPYSRNLRGIHSNFRSFLGHSILFEQMHVKSCLRNVYKLFSCNCYLEERSNFKFQLHILNG